MKSFTFRRWLGGSLVLLFFAVTPGRALLRFNDGHDQVYVIGTAVIGWDSNIFSNQVASADTMYTASVNLEYRRKAGYIGFNGTLGWDFGRFEKFTAQNYANPHLSLEFAKDSGRTTYDLLLGATRQNGSDSAANVRAQSLTYRADLNWKYPNFLNNRLTLSGAFGWSELTYQNNPALVGLSSYTGGLDLYYSYSDERDLLVGYRVRLSDTSSNTSDIDHNFSVGVVGKVIAKLTGSLRIGWQIREVAATPTTPASSFTGLSATSAISYPLTKRTAFTGQLSKDFTTTSTDISTDSLTANANLTYAYNAKFSIFANLGGGMSKFLGAAGAGRRDNDLTWGTGFNWTRSEHFKATLAYDWFRNWSNFSRADFTRNGINLTLTSRW